MENQETSEAPAPITIDAIEMYRWPGENDINHLPDQNTLDDIDLGHQCVLDVGCHPDIQPSTSLGTLDTLPLEILSNFLLHLDIPTLTAYRQVNAKATETVDFLYQYKTVVAHCPNVLRAIVSTRSTALTIDSLYNILFIEKCSKENCHLFGVHLNLLTAKRYCFDHFTDCRVVPASRVLEITDRTMDQLKELPHMYSVPGRYSPKAMAYGSEMLIAVETLNDRAGLPTAITDRLVPKFMDPDAWDRMAGLSYVVVVSTPFLSGPGPTADWGVRCAVCERRWYGWIATISGGMYTERGFLEHFTLHGLPVDDSIGGKFHAAHLPGGEYYLKEGP